VAWSPDGQQLASGSADRTIRVIQSWALRPPCELVTRNLTLGEWRHYLPDRPYHATCPNHPALDQVGQP
jgi:WD40 repeat protein